MAVAVAFLGSATAPQDANALTGSQSPTQLDGITQWVARNGAATNQGTLGCNSVCTDLWLSEHRPIPNQPSSTQMWDELLTTTETVGSSPKWSAATKGLAVVGAFTTGYAIGS
ncbi:MAG: hypothetical protein ACJ762_11325, partial [Solirubrobacteraceae bacterium]